MVVVTRHERTNAEEKYAEMNVQGMQEECRRKQVRIGGNKSELISRLAEYDLIIKRYRRQM